MQTVNIHEAKTQFSRFIDQAEEGEEIVIARAGKPVARLVALETRANKPHTLGLDKNLFTFPDQFDRLNAGEVVAMSEQLSR
ncbi:MAG: type II toxin-antitoxin system prevent-host-death family antitoxin [Acidithiobacillus sp.]